MNEKIIGCVALAKDFLEALADSAAKAVKLIDYILKDADPKEIEAAKTKVYKLVLVNDSEEPKAAEAKEEKPAEAQKKEFTLEEVRTKLAELSKNGFTKEVKELLQKFNATRLSAVKKEDYEAILKEAEAIGNAN